MTVENTMMKVDILIQQGKYPEAERVLNDLLSGDSNNTDFLALLAEVHLQQDKFESAQRLADNAIGISPDSPHLYYTRARIAIQQDDYDGAEHFIRRSIELDPYDADYFALLANVSLARKKFEEALVLADKALELDPENILGLNTRSTALLKLNRHEDSFQTIEGALREDPNNAYTHANYGWSLLERGDHKQARVHFQESLKADPNFEYARDGMVEALKASNPIYRAFLKYAFWMGNLTSKYQWGVIIGFYLATRVLRGIANQNEELKPFLFPIVIALAVFAFSTWILEPISNLFLRFSVYGQVLLDRKEKMSSNFVAASLGLFLLGLLMYFLMFDEKFIPIAAFGFAMMLPFSLMFSSSKYKNAFLIYAIAMTIIGLLAIGITFSTGEIFNAMSIVFVLGFIAFQWVANFLLIREDNR